MITKKHLKKQVAYFEELHTREAKTIVEQEEKILDLTNEIESLKRYFAETEQEHSDNLDALYSELESIYDEKVSLQDELLDCQDANDGINVELTEAREVIRALNTKLEDTRRELEDMEERYEVEERYGRDYQDQIEDLTEQLEIMEEKFKIEECNNKDRNNIVANLTAELDLCRNELSIITNKYRLAEQHIDTLQTNLTETTTLLRYFKTQYEGMVREQSNILAGLRRLKARSAEICGDEKETK